MLRVFFASMLVSAHVVTVLSAQTVSPLMRSEAKPSSHPAKYGQASRADDSTRLGGVTRTYCIAADELDWDYTPGGRNLAGVPHGEMSEAEGPAGSRHVVYHKAIYREYTDARFRTLKVRPQQWQHLGILGPLI